MNACYQCGKPTCICFQNSTILNMPNGSTVRLCNAEPKDKLESVIAPKSKEELARDYAHTQIPGAMLKAVSGVHLKEREMDAFRFGFDAGFARAVELLRSEDVRKWHNQLYDDSAGGDITGEDFASWLQRQENK